MAEWEATYEIKMKGVVKDGISMMTFSAPNYEKAFDLAKRGKCAFSASPKCSVKIVSVEQACAEPSGPSKDEEQPSRETARIGFNA